MPLASARGAEVWERVGGHGVRKSRGVIGGRQEGGGAFVGSESRLETRKGCAMGSKQTVRQAARRAAFQMQQRRREEETKRERRLTNESIKLMVALRERDDAEARARDAIRAMEAEGLDAAAIVRWSNGELEAKEIARLRDFVPRYADPERATKPDGHPS